MRRMDTVSCYRSVVLLGAIAFALTTNLGGCPAETAPSANPSTGANGTSGSGTDSTPANNGSPSGDTYSPVFISNPSSSNSGGTNTVVAGDSATNDSPNTDPPPSGDTPVNPGDPDDHSGNPDGGSTPIDPPPPPPPPPPQQPVLEVTPTLLQFGRTLSVLTFQVRNAGTGSLNYSIYPGEFWADLDTTSGSSSGEYDTITVTCDRTWLVDYTITYTTELTVEASTGESIRVQVETMVPPPTFVPILSHAALDFGSDVDQITLTISNGNNFPVPFSLAADDPWVTVSTTTGSVPAAPAVRTIYVTANRCDLLWTPGQRVGNIRFTFGYGFAPIDIPISAFLDAPPSNSELAVQLASLPALPKKHISYGHAWHMVEDLGSGLLFEFVRITHSITIEAIAAATQPTHVPNAVLACKLANADNPAIPASISFKYSPYEYFIAYGTPPWYNGPEVQQELDAMTAYLNGAKTALAAANTQHGTNVVVDRIVLNCERWRAKRPTDPGADEWNEASRLKYNAAYNICRSIFPTATVHWYNRGKPIERGGYFTLTELGDECSMETYFPHDLEALRYRYQLGYQYSQTIGEVPVPWIDLNGAFVTLPSGETAYMCGYDYPLQNAWQIGYEVNCPDFVPPQGQVAPLNASPVAALYPSPFVSTEPEFGEYFVAFVKGAANIPLEP